MRLVQDAADRYDVCFLDSDVASDGGKIRLSAGAPRFVGDDEERMLLALRHIVEADPPLPVKVGVNRGPVFTGPVGPDYRRWYAVMGDTVNLAARLVGKAPAGRIYATRDVLRGAKTTFEQTMLLPFAVKGKSRPVQAWDVGPPVRGSSEVAIRLELPLVGRARELDQLRSAIAGAQRSAGSLIELCGETGSGKSRLLAEAANLATGMVSLRAACEVYTRETPYSAWRDLLRQVLGVGAETPDAEVLDRLRAEIELTDPGLAPWMSLIAIVLDVELGPSVEVEQLSSDARPAKLREVVLRLLRRALVVPTIVEVDQAQLMDGASVELFEALATELESTAWVVLVGRRDEPGGLVPADPACSDRARAAVAGGHPRARAVDRGGDPGAAPCGRARRRALGGQPAVPARPARRGRAGNRDELPESVGAATMARIDALDPADGALVRRAAVLGLSFQPDRLEDVLEAGMPLPDERFWDRMSVVFAREPDGHVRFRRPALQEVAYSSLPFKLRRELHLAVGLRLEREQAGDHDANAAVLSNHFALAGDHARAQRYAMIAASRASERFAHADAARLYRRAIDAGRAIAVRRRTVGRWPRRGSRWARRCDRVGEPAAASRALTEARRLLRDDPLAQARVCQTATRRWRSEAMR